jgi:hypothetical protein
MVLWLTDPSILMLSLTLLLVLAALTGHDGKPVTTAAAKNAAAANPVITFL